MAPEPVVRILLVDDNENNLMSMEVVLERQGYTFFKASSGRDALRILLHQDDISLILLDVKMPIMDGYETADLIYQRDRLKHIPIIFITAHDYEEDAMFRGYKTGAVDFIRKPINSELLRSKVAVFSELYRKNMLLRLQEEKLQTINHDLLILNQDLEKRVLERTLALENANNELKELNLSKDKFLSVISHDLRNPLTSLILSSEILNADTESISTQEIKKFSGIIHRTSNNILKQLNELVDWAKTQREKLNFNPQKLCLKNEINESLEFLRANANQKSIELKNEVDESIQILADHLMLRSILQNLVTNAIKFTPENGKEVKLLAEISGDWVEICIQDQGIGMSDETKELLFNNLNAPSIPGTNQEKGTGLGMLLVKDFVTQHNGEITVTSELNKGTCFKFTIPKFCN